MTSGLISIMVRGCPVPVKCYLAGISSEFGRFSDEYRVTMAQRNDNGVTLTVLLIVGGIIDHGGARMKTAHQGGHRVTLLFEIKGNSLDDGPGIRTVVFFKGCPLNCAWCHNPESKSPGQEIAYDPNTCIDCGRCREACLEQAILPGNPHSIDRTRCTLCCACIDACPSGALTRVGFEKTVEEVVRIALRDKPFFDNSKGGVTLSGGEPTMHMDYVADLARGLKEEKIHVLLETCGFFPYDRFRELLLPHLDAVYFDLKIFDDARHRTYCGASNNRILDNFRSLAHEATGSGLALLPRIPLVPGITDTDDNLHSIAAFLQECRVSKVDLLPYNPLWHDKCRSIGADTGMAVGPGMNGFMHRDHVRHCWDIIRRCGLAGKDG